MLRFSASYMGQHIPHAWVPLSLLRLASLAPTISGDSNHESRDYRHESSV
jgi:hypothetical protein